MQLSTLSVAVGASLAGCLLAVAIPTFLANVQLSRLAEPMRVLSTVGTRASALAVSRESIWAYPAPAPQTPAEVPRGVLVKDAQGWEHPTWRELGIRESGHAFAYRFQSENGPKVASFIATAHADLDGDGLVSTFTLRGAMEEGHHPTLAPIDIEREVE